jgi:hypothetical protein
LKPELLRAIVDSGFEHPSEGKVLITLFTICLWLILKLMSRSLQTYFSGLKTHAAYFVVFYAISDILSHKLIGFCNSCSHLINYLDVLYNLTKAVDA